MRPRGWIRLALVLGSLAAMAVALLRTYPPYVTVAGVAVLASAIAFVLERGAARVVAFNLGAIALVLGVGEFAAWRATPAGPLRTTTEPNFVTSHPVLGNAPEPGVLTRVSRWDGDSLIFRVRYTIDSLGWRWTPVPAAPPESTRDVLFFGCSLTFGEGLGDSATLPAQVSLQSHGRWRAHNFGFSGYGPHQMLKIVEDSLEARSIAAAPAAAIYQAIPGHVYRALGRTTWDPGPRYRLDRAGHARFAGRFLTPRASLALNLFYRSFLLRRVLDAWNARLDADDFRTFFAIVDDARRTLERRYPGIAFTVLYWDSRDRTRAALALDDSLLAGFAARGIRVVTAGELLPDYPDSAARYFLGPHDAHPNARADRALAAALLRRERTLPAAGRMQ